MLRCLSCFTKACSCTNVESEEADQRALQELQNIGNLRTPSSPSQALNGSITQANIETAEQGVNINRGGIPDVQQEGQQNQLQASFGRRVKPCYDDFEVTRLVRYMKQGSWAMRAMAAEELWKEAAVRPLVHVLAQHEVASALVTILREGTELGKIYAAYTLLVLLKDPDSIDKVVDEGAVQALQPVVASSHLPAARMAALRALARLARHRRAAAVLMALEGHKVLRDLLMDQEHHSGLVKGALVTLYYLGADKNHIQDELGRAGLIPRLLELCVCDNACVAHKAVQVVKVLCKSVLCCRALQAAGAPAVLKSIIAQEGQADDNTGNAGNDRLTAGSAPAITGSHRDGDSSDNGSFRQKAPEGIPAITGSHRDGNSSDNCSLRRKASEGKHKQHQPQHDADDSGSRRYTDPSSNENSSRRHTAPEAQNLPRRPQAHNPLPQTKTQDPRHLPKIHNPQQQPGSNPAGSNLSRTAPGSNNDISSLDLRHTAPGNKDNSSNDLWHTVPSSYNNSSSGNPRHTAPEGGHPAQIALERLELVLRTQQNIPSTRPKNLLQPYEVDGPAQQQLLIGSPTPCTPAPLSGSPIGADSNDALKSKDNTPARADGILVPDGAHHHNHLQAAIVTGSSGSGSSSRGPLPQTKGRAHRLGKKRVAWAGEVDQQLQQPAVDQQHAPLSTAASDQQQAPGPTAALGQQPAPHQQLLQQHSTPEELQLQPEQESAAALNQQPVPHQRLLQQQSTPEELQLQPGQESAAALNQQPVPHQRLLQQQSTPEELQLQPEQGSTAALDQHPAPHQQLLQQQSMPELLRPPQQLLQPAPGPTAALGQQSTPHHRLLQQQSTLKLLQLRQQHQQPAQHQQLFQHKLSTPNEQQHQQPQHQQRFRAAQPLASFDSSLGGVQRAQDSAAAQAFIAVSGSVARRWTVEQQHKRARDGVSPIHDNRAAAGGDGGGKGWPGVDKQQESINGGEGRWGAGMLQTMQLCGNGGVGVRSGAGVPQPVVVCSNGAATQSVGTDTLQQVRSDAPQQVRSDTHQQVRTGAPQELKSDAPQQVRLDAPQQVRSDTHQQVRTGAPQELKSDAPQQVRLDAPQQVRSDAHQQVRTGAPQDLKLDAPQQVRSGAGVQQLGAKGGAGACAQDRTLAVPLSPASFKMQQQQQAAPLSPASFEQQQQQQQQQQAAPLSPASFKQRQQQQQQQQQHVHDSRLPTVQPTHQHHELQGAVGSAASGEAPAVGLSTSAASGIGAGTDWGAGARADKAAKTEAAGAARAAEGAREAAPALTQPHPPEQPSPAKAPSESTPTPTSPSSHSPAQPLTPLVPPNTTQAPPPLQHQQSPVPLHHQHSPLGARPVEHFKTFMSPSTSRCSGASSELYSCDSTSTPILPMPPSFPPRPVIHECGSASDTPDAGASARIQRRFRPALWNGYPRPRKREFARSGSVGSQQLAQGDAATEVRGAESAPPCERTGHTGGAHAEADTCSFRKGPSANGRVRRVLDMGVGAGSHGVAGDASAAQGRPEHVQVQRFASAAAVSDGAPVRYPASVPVPIPSEAERGGRWEEQDAVHCAAQLPSLSPLRVQVPASRNISSRRSSSRSSSSSSSISSSYVSSCVNTGEAWLRDSPTALGPTVNSGSSPGFTPRGSRDARVPSLLGRQASGATATGWASGATTQTSPARQHLTDHATTGEARGAAARSSPTSAFARPSQFVPLVPILSPPDPPSFSALTSTHLTPAISDPHSSPSSPAASTTIKAPPDTSHSSPQSNTANAAHPSLTGGPSGPATHSDSHHQQTSSAKPHHPRHHPHSQPHKRAFPQHPIRRPATFLSASAPAFHVSVKEAVAAMERTPLPLPPRHPQQAGTSHTNAATATPPPPSTVTTQHPRRQQQQHHHRQEGAAATPPLPLPAGQHALHNMHTRPRSPVRRASGGSFKAVDARRISTGHPASRMSLDNGCRRSKMDAYPSHHPLRQPAQGPGESRNPARPLSSSLCRVTSRQTMDSFRARQGSSPAINDGSASGQSPSSRTDPHDSCT